jgi:hypothetical protein
VAKRCRKNSPVKNLKKNQKKIKRSYKKNQIKKSKCLKNSKKEQNETLLNDNIPVPFSTDSISM